MFCENIIKSVLEYYTYYYTCVKHNNNYTRDLAVLTRIADIEELNQQYKVGSA